MERKFFNIEAHHNIRGHLVSRLKMAAIGGALFAGGNVESASRVTTGPQVVRSSTIRT